MLAPHEAAVGAGLEQKLDRAPVVLCDGARQWRVHEAWQEEDANAEAAAASAAATAAAAAAAAATL